MRRYSSAFGTWWEDYTAGEAFYIGKRKWSAVDLARMYGWRGITSAQHAARALAFHGIRTVDQLARTDPDDLRTKGDEDAHTEKRRIADHAIKLLELILEGEGRLNDLWKENAEQRQSRTVVVGRKRTGRSGVENSSATA